MDKNIAVIPVRVGSTRVPKKNFLDFFGKPMFVHTYNAARESGLFEDIVISTDSDEILELCRQYSIPTPYSRPKNLGTDTVSLNDVVLHAVQEMEKKGKTYSTICLLWATAPMRDAADIRKAYEMLQLNKDAEAVIGVTDCFQYYPAHINDENGFIKPLVCFDNMTTLRAQDVPKTYVDNGSMAWVRKDAFVKQHNWMPAKSKGYWMPRTKSVDLDTPEDLELLTHYFATYAVASPEEKPRREDFCRVFFDTEFTRGGQNTTLISVGFTDEKGNELYIELNDYDAGQVTPWLQENILNLLDGKGVSSPVAAKKITDWFNLVADGKRIQLVSAGKEVDSVLLYNLWADVEPGSNLRSWHDKLPPAIDHRFHIDLDTIFSLHGFDPSLDRRSFAGGSSQAVRHKAIDDARVIRACWKKMVNLGWLN